MKEFEVEKRTCGNCNTFMQVGFFIYNREDEQFDRWLETVELATKYCDSCFREVPKVELFIEFFCPECGDYKGVYMECTPYSKAYFLAEVSVSRK